MCHVAQEKSTENSGEDKEYDSHYPVDGGSHWHKFHTKV